MGKIEAELKLVNGELKTERFKGAVAEAGSAIMDGISSVLGTSKVKWQEQEIAELRGEITEKKRENTSLKKEIDALQSTIVRIADESGKVAQGLHSEIAHLYDLMPELKGLLQIEKICQTLGFSEDLIKPILNRDTVGFKGSLYSPEHCRWLTTDYSEAKIIQDPNEKGRLRFTVDGVHINTRLARKYEEQYPRPRIKESQRQNQGMGVKW